ncbi:unnamed protein product [Sphagnum balticum]
MSGEIALVVSDDREAPFKHVAVEDAQEELTRVGNEQEKTDHCVLEIHNFQNKQEEKQQSRVTRERNSASGEREEEEEEEEQEVNPAEEEARCRLEIEKDKKLKLTLRAWEEQYKITRERVEKKSTRAINVKNEFYQLIGYYSVFQGVVLTAVAQSSTIFCKQSWGPASLSLLATIVTVLGVHFKLIDYTSIKIALDQEIKDSKVLHEQISELKARGKKFDFKWLKEKLISKEKYTDKARIRRQKLEKRYYWAVIAALLLFSVIILLCCIIVLCDPSKYKSSSSSFDPNDSYKTLRVWHGKEAVLGVSTDEMIDNIQIIIEYEDGGFTKTPVARENKRGKVKNKVKEVKKHLVSKFGGAISKTFQQLDHHLQAILQEPKDINTHTVSVTNNFGKFMCMLYAQ